MSLKRLARTIGLVSAVAVILATQLLDQGLVTSDGGKNLLHAVVIGIPLVAAELISYFTDPDR